MATSSDCDAGHDGTALGFDFTMAFQRIVDPRARPRFNGLKRLAPVRPITTDCRHAGRPAPGLTEPTSAAVA